MIDRKLAAKMRKLGNHRRGRANHSRNAPASGCLPSSSGCPAGSGGGPGSGQGQETGKIQVAGRSQTANRERTMGSPGRTSRPTTQGDLSHGQESDPQESPV